MEDQGISSDKKSKKGKYILRGLNPRPSSRGGINHSAAVTRRLILIPKILQINKSLKMHRNKSNHPFKGSTKQMH